MMSCLRMEFPSKERYSCKSRIPCGHSPARWKRCWWVLRTPPELSVLVGLPLGIALQPGGVQECPYLRIQIFGHGIVVVVVSFHLENLRVKAVLFQRALGVVHQR